MEKQTVNFHGMQCKAINYKGVQIINNCLNGAWMLFFDSNVKSSSPYAGTLSQMKKIVDEDGSDKFIKSNTYK